MVINVSLYSTVEQALEAAKTTGLPCYFPPGDWDGDGLTVPTQVSLLGAGRASRIIGTVKFEGNYGKSIQNLTFAGKVIVEAVRYCEWRNVRFEDQLEMVPNVRVPGQAAAFCHYNKFISCWFRGSEGGNGIIDPIVSYGQNNFNWFDGCAIVPSPNSALGGVSILSDPLGGTAAADGWICTQLSIEANKDGAYKPFLNISGREHHFSGLWLELRHAPEVTWADGMGVRFNVDSRHCVLERSVLGSQFGKYPAQGIFNVQNLGRFNTIQDRRTDRDIWDEGPIVSANPDWVTQDQYETAGGTVPPEPDHYGG